MFGAICIKETVKQKQKAIVPKHKIHTYTLVHKKCFALYKIKSRAAVQNKTENVD